jgi:uncharacterized membrane protein
MNTSRPLGIAVLILGAVLVGFAYHFSEAPLEQISNSLAGRYSDATMWYLIGGIALVVTGGFLIVSGRRL